MPSFPKTTRRLSKRWALFASDKKEEEEENETSLLQRCSSDAHTCIFVNVTSDRDPNDSAAAAAAQGGGGDDDDSSSIGDGTLHHPVRTAAEAVQMSRRIRRRRRRRDSGATAAAAGNITIVFRAGIHFLRDTLHLDRHDSHLTITSYPGEEVWLSGGVALPNSNSSRYNISWSYDCNLNLHVRVANLTNLLLQQQQLQRSGGSATTPTTARHSPSVPAVPALFTTRARLIRARFPNGNPEIDPWGYNTPGRLDHSIPPDQVLRWHRPDAAGVPRFDYADLRFAGKNDSTMAWYNAYASGTGGACADLWGTAEASYWCSNASAGGWSEVDRECALTGRLQIPVGVTVNGTSSIGRRLSQWGGAAVGGIVHAWHSQSWAMHMFRIDAVPDNNNTGNGTTFLFEKGGGRQGGRNWCRCDQCTYAGHWCRQHQTPPDPSDDRLISGTWMVENVLTELDAPGEFYFDPATNLLYLYPNATDDDPTGLNDLRFALLDTLIDMRGATDITISNLGFRDAAPTYMGDWSVPSGGDWALHRGGAIFMEDVDNITIRDCTFRRLDGNAVFLSRRTRNVAIRRSIFEWLGENAIALWGQTDGYNATKREFPIGTIIEGNVMRELGIYQKQSSGVAHNKAAKTTIRNNLMFNMPRAAINFNDMVGGGDVVERNLIFNTCRESGDHGPINSWDRQPFLTDIRDGTHSFVPERRVIAYNLIFANYGAAQGVDNDDGSSWYHEHHNVWYNSDGFKMDYGGHDSIFEDNLVLNYPHKSNCIGFGSFLPNHGHIVRRNRCVVPHHTDSPVIGLSDCADPSNAVRIHSNRYYAPGGNVTALCGYQSDPITLTQMQEQYLVEKGSTVDDVPDSIDTIAGWAIETLFREEGGGSDLETS
jgi:Right handed beta helix region